MGSDWFVHIFVGRKLDDAEAKELWESKLRELIVDDDNFDPECLFLSCDEGCNSPECLTRENGHPIRLLCPAFSFSEVTSTTPHTQFVWFVVQEYIGKLDYHEQFDYETFPKPQDKRYGLIAAMDFV